MTKKAKPKKLRLKGVHLPKDVKRREKKLLKVPGKLQKEHTKRREKALLKIPVKPAAEKPIETPEPPSKPEDLGIKPIQPDEIERILQAMQPQEPKKLGEKIKRGQYEQALQHGKEWLIKHMYQWDWKSITSVTALLIIALLSLMIILKVYSATSTWEEDAQKIEIPEDQLFQPTVTDAEREIEQLREKLDTLEPGSTPRTSSTSTRTTSSSTSSFPSPTITKTPQKTYVRTGSPTTVPGQINEYAIRKFLADAGDLYYMIPKDGQFQLGFMDHNGDPIQNLMYYTEGGFLTPGRTRSAEFTLYIPQGYITDITTTTDPCGLVQQIYNSKNYQFNALRNEMTLRQKYGGILRNVRDCRNREP